MKLKISMFAIMVGVGLLTACGGKENPGQTKDEPATATEVPPQEEEAKEVTLTIEANDDQEYNKEELRVKSGQIVTLVLKNVGKMPRETMGHNWVLLKKGTDVAAFAQAAMTEKENDYIPADASSIIAHTEMIGGGQEAKITFEAPYPGKYPFMCSFPGHFAKMKGILVIE